MSSVISTLKGFFSGDTLVIFILLVVFFCYAMFLGRGRILSLILAFFPATLLFNNFPFVNQLLVLNGDKLVLLNKIGIFLLFLAPLSIIINRFIFSASEYTGTSKIFRTLGLSVVAVVLVLVFSYSTVSLDAFHDFSPKIDLLFTGMDKTFYWNIGVLALLALL